MNTVEYNTWNITLWVANEEYSYRAARYHGEFDTESARLFIEELYPNGTPDMDGPDYDNVDWNQVTEDLNELLD